MSSEEHLRKDAAENRMRILEAAAHVFGEHGVEASVDDVAHAAGVGIGTLYRRFANKDALISALVDDLLGELSGEAQKALAKRDGKGLERFLKTSAKLQAKNRGCLTRLWVDGRHEKIDAMRTCIEDLLIDAQEHGEIRDDVTVGDVYVLSWSFKGIIDLTHVIAPVAWQRHLDLLIAGLRPSATKLAHAPLTAKQIDAIRARRT